MNTCKQIYTRKLTPWLCVFQLLLCLGLAPQAYAADEASAEEMAQSKSAYLQIKPTIITNYAGGKLKYVRTDIALRVSNETKSNLMNHMDAVKDILIMLLARQDKETLTTSDGLQTVKEEAKEEILTFLAAEGGPADIMEVLFMSFLVE